MPSRYFRVSFLHHPALEHLSVGANLLTTLLPMMADDQGCFHASPRFVWASLWPHDTPSVTMEQVCEWLAELERAGLVEFHRAPELIGRLTEWPKMVYLNPSRSGKARFTLTEETRVTLGLPLGSPRDSLGDTEHSHTGISVTGYKEQVQGQTRVKKSRAPVHAPVTVGKNGFEVPEDVVNRWMVTYDALDVFEELDKIFTWHVAHQRWTRGFYGHITRWLGKENTERKAAGNLSAVQKGGTVKPGWKERQDSRDLSLKDRVAQQAEKFKHVKPMSEVLGDARRGASGGGLDRASLPAPVQRSGNGTLDHADYGLAGGSDAEGRSGDAGGGRVPVDLRSPASDHVRGDAPERAERSRDAGDDREDPQGGPGASASH